MGGRARDKRKRERERERERERIPRKRRKISTVRNPEDKDLCLTLQGKLRKEARSRKRRMNLREVTHPKIWGPSCKPAGTPLEVHFAIASLAQLSVQDRGRGRHSQLQDEDDVGLVLVDFVQGDDIGVLDLLQDADLTLDVLAAHAPPAGLGPSFLDELGCVLEPRALLTASLHHGELSAEKTRGIGTGTPAIVRARAL
jgi:hypothetical protein